MKSEVDFVVVSWHWGVEYTSQPTSRQIELAHLAVASGANLVIGNHPHWVQGTERYQGKLITYAHGNFVFDQMWSEATRKGVIGRYTFDEQGEVEVEFIPIVIENYGQARIDD